MISRASTPASAGRSMRRSRLAGRERGLGAHEISSPVSRTNTSSRLAGRRSPSGASPLRRSSGDGRAGAPRGQAGRLRLGLHRGQPARRPVDLDRLLARMLGDQVARRSLRHGAAVRHDRDGVRQPLGLLDVVRRHQDRRPLGAQQVDQRPQLLAHLRVEADGRLVEQHEARLVHQPAGDQQPPAHAARQLVHARVAAVAEVGQLERALHGRPALAAPEPVEIGEHDQVLLDRQRRVEVVELRHDAALRAGELGLRGQRVAEHADLALVGDRLRREHLHRRRLARAVRPEQPHARALGQVEVEVVDGGDGAIGLHDAAKRDGEGSGHTPSRMTKAERVGYAASARRGMRATRTRPSNSASCAGRPTIASACHWTPTRNGRAGSSTASTVPSGATATARSPVPELARRLVMEGVDRQRPAAGQRGEARVPGDGDGVELLVRRRDLTVAVDVLMQRPAADHVDGLGAAADAEQGHPALVGRAGQRELGSVDDRVGRAEPRVPLARPVGERVEIGTAGEHEPVEPVEQGDGDVGIVRRQHDRQPARGLDRAQIGRPEPQLPLGCALVAALQRGERAGVPLRGEHADKGPHTAIVGQTWPSVTWTFGQNRLLTS